MSESEVLELLKEIKVRPRKEDVLLLVDQPEMLSEIIHAPAANPETGVILAVGPDTYDVYPGQRVWFSYGDPGVVLDHIKDRLRLVHQSVLQGEVLDG